MSGDSLGHAEESETAPEHRDRGPDEAQLPVADAAAGDPRVDAALRRAAELANTPPSEHVAIYEDVHSTLQEVLADAAGSGAGRFRGPSSTAGDPER